MNLIFWVKGSSAAVPFSTLIALLALWFGVSVPLTFIGAYFGFKKRVNIYKKYVTLYINIKIQTNPILANSHLISIIIVTGASSKN